MGQDRPGTPVMSFPWTSITQPELVEIIDTAGPDYTPLLEGTAYPDATNYPDHVLLYQDPIDHQYLRRLYLNITKVKFEEQVSIPIRNEQIMAVGSSVVFILVNGVGTEWFPFRSARTRQVEATVLHWLSIGEVKLPLTSAQLALSNGKTVINSDSTGTSANVNLWNVSAASAHLWFGFAFEDVISDVLIYPEGGALWNGISLTQQTIAASVPSATQYLTEVAAGDYGLKDFESVRLKSNIFSNRATCFPLL